MSAKNGTPERRSYGQINGHQSPSNACPLASLASAQGDQLNAKSDGMGSLTCSNVDVPRKSPRSSNIRMEHEQFGPGRRTKLNDRIQDYITVNEDMSSDYTLARTEFLLKKTPKSQSILSNINSFIMVLLLFLPLSSLADPQELQGPQKPRYTEVWARADLTVGRNNNSKKSKSNYIQAELNTEIDEIKINEALLKIPRRYVQNICGKMEQCFALNFLIPDINPFPFLSINPRTNRDGPTWAKTAHLLVLSDLSDPNPLLRKKLGSGKIELRDTNFSLKEIIDPYEWEIKNANRPKHYLGQFLDQSIFIDCDGIIAGSIASRCHYQINSKNYKMEFNVPENFLSLWHSIAMKSLDYLNDRAKQ
jgi:hypothetical protein